MFFLFTFKNKEEKNCGFKKKDSRIFKNLIFLQIKNLLNTFFLIFIIHKPSRWSRDVPQKIWARSVYWIQTNKQTDRQAKFIYIDSVDLDNFQD